MQTDECKQTLKLSQGPQSRRTPNHRMCFRQNLIGSHASVTELLIFDHMIKRYVYMRTDILRERVTHSKIKLAGAVNPSPPPPRPRFPLQGYLDPLPHVRSKSRDPSCTCFTSLMSFQKEAALIHEEN